MEVSDYFSLKAEKSLAINTNAYNPLAIANFELLKEVPKANLDRFLKGKAEIEPVWCFRKLSYTVYDTPALASSTLPEKATVCFKRYS